MAWNLDSMEDSDVGAIVWYWLGSLLIAIVCMYFYLRPFILMNGELASLYVSYSKMPEEHQQKILYKMRRASDRLNPDYMPLSIRDFLAIHKNNHMCMH